MPERFIDQDERYVKRPERRSNSASWIMPLLLLPIAFLGGWVANGYVNEGQVNGIPGIDVGVGGGPEERQTISPLPASDIVTPTVTPTISITPTEEFMTPMPTSTQ